MKSNRALVGVAANRLYGQFMGFPVTESAARSRVALGSFDFETRITCFSFKDFDKKLDRSVRKAFSIALIASPFGCCLISLYRMPMP